MKKKVTLLLFWICVSFISAAEGAVIKGVIRFEGTPLAPKPINFGAERQCAEYHAEKPAFYEEIVVNPNGTLRWALVYVKEGVSGEFKAPEIPVVIDQTGCIFVPHAAGVLAGQPVLFKNSDALLHNVRNVAKETATFNIAQPIQGMTTKHFFDQPEIGIQLKCDVHYWMSAFLHVLPHPFFSITDEEGKFEITGLPAGTYTVEVWHEKLGIQAETVTVEEGKPANLEVFFGSVS